jgi:hypothetical protein
MQYGIEEVVENSRQYKVSNVRSVERQVVDDAMYYRYNVELSDESSRTVDTAFTIYYRRSTSEMNVRAFSYSQRRSSSSSSSSRSSSRSSSSYSSSSSRSSRSSSRSSRSSSSSSRSYKYSRIEISQVESSSKYQEILQYGVRESIQQLQRTSFIATSDFEVSQVINVYMQRSGSDENYKFNVQLANYAGITLDTSFEVQYKRSSRKMSLLSYSAEGLSPNRLDEVMIASYTTEEEQELSMANYERVAESEIETSNDIQEIVQYGAQETAKRVSRRESFSSSDFQVRRVNRVYREVVNKRRYRVESTLVNSRGVSIDASYTVDYNAAQESRNLETYSYIAYE